ncbi:hypothetical protein EYZ11_012443 [Aspergillus tanneri]|uniref:Uncharacterized protein n=1 Tax=Aspergillus tanneri TaxID=1220188 RepID=A0A4S3J085_9EURO|nr:hypothetical protein EYZ11_012443 [Aspergillus tanneri]
MITAIECISVDAHGPLTLAGTLPAPALDTRTTLSTNNGSSTYSILSPKILLDGSCVFRRLTFTESKESLSSIVTCKDLVLLRRKIEQDMHGLNNQSRLRLQKMLSAVKKAFAEKNGIF